jgi:hypothetical protein
MDRGAIGWSSKLQPIVVLSRTEVEYMVATKAAKEVLWMCNILHKFGFLQHGASPLNINCQSAMSVSKNPEHSGQMKHLNLQFFWL